MTSAVVPWRAPAAHGDRPAIVDGSVVWTHGRLGARVDAWAAAIAATAHHGEHVAVQLPHGAEVVAAWLGILTAGRAALVLDPEQPVPQRTGALVFAEAGLLLASADDARLLRDAGFHGIVLDPEDVAQRAATTCPALGDPATRACLFFTSGSTGVPRAVVWRRRTLACAARHLDAMFAFAPTDRHALLAPLAVAATAAQVTATLAAGASLHLREARRHATSDVARWLRDAGITTLQTVPSLHRALSAAPRQWPTLRALKLGGETVTAADAQRFAATAPAGAILINGLGLTEAGFNVCWHVWRAGDPLDGPFVPIGRPPPGVELRLDGDEILVASPALADGYWRDPARTAERYRALPDRPGWRELRTGDAGRWRADGALEHLGRRDAMVKVRGHRVDPAEVEAALLATTGVAEAVVVPADGDEVRLCAFVRLHAGTALTPAALHRSLAARLPAHMLPSSLRIVDALPMLDGGKIDRRALLQLAATAAPAVDDAAPRDALERTLLACFRRVLPRQPFGIGASFFELGGDSLAAAELFAALAALLRIELPLADLTRNPSVEQLAEHIRRAGAQPTDDPVALLSPSPDPRATNLFMWPGAGSDVMALADLGRHLGPEV
ncbi:MAG TPA: AMP-binding protein, partial [Candidatus Binatia bacterium]|nr:AMP-binding protein [Candidatus Binatia bacterium]